MEYTSPDGGFGFFINEDSSEVADAIEMRMAAFHMEHSHLMELIQHTEEDHPDVLDASLDITDEEYEKVFASVQQARQDITKLSMDAWRKDHESLSPGFAVEELTLLDTFVLYLFQWKCRTEQARKPSTEN